MFCPRCAADNQTDAKYCRACGADIHLVPRALAGLLPAEPAEAGHKPSKESKKGEEGRLFEKGMENIFTSFAFALIVLGGLFYMRGAFFLWVWFIIPALGNFGKGVGQLVRSRRERRLPPIPAGAARELDAPEPGALFVPPRASQLPAPDTAEIVESPFSVTEATTRHLNSRAGNAPTEF